MGNIGEIDFDSVEESSFDAIPAGDYTVIITNSEVSDNKKGNGKHAKFTFQVCDGPHKNRLLWHWVNFKHVNPTTQNIGLRELKELGLACGFPTFSDTSQLHNIPIRVKVGLEDDQNGEKRNVIKRVLWKETAGGAKKAAAPVAAEVDDGDSIPF